MFTPLHNYKQLFDFFFKHIDIITFLLKIFVLWFEWNPDLFYLRSNCFEELLSLFRPLDVRIFLVLSSPQIIFLQQSLQFFISLLFSLPTFMHIHTQMCLYMCVFCNGFIASPLPSFPPFPFSSIKFFICPYLCSALM